MAQQQNFTKLFVGNIPYDYQESELIETLEMVGPLKGGIDIKRDERTNKPKGFGFCEYKDQESKISALKNIKNIEFNGRQLEVNTENNQKNTILTEEQYRISKDFAFIKENFSGLNDLNDSQKSFLFLFCKILQDNYPREFESLLFLQEEKFLTDFLSFQEEFLNKSQIS